jgi:hypothetical protein
VAAFKNQEPAPKSIRLFTVPYSFFRGDWNTRASRATKKLIGVRREKDTRFSGFARTVAIMKRRLKL